MNQALSHAHSAQSTAQTNRQRLDEQSEQINRMHRQLNHVDESVSLTGKVINGISSWSSSVWNSISGNPTTPTRSDAPLINVAHPSSVNQPPPGSSGAQGVQQRRREPPQESSYHYNPNLDELDHMVSTIKHDSHHMNSQLKAQNRALDNMAQRTDNATSQVRSQHYQLERF
jgi:methyl-accepting chemotaxis protein